MPLLGKACNGIAGYFLCGGFAGYGLMAAAAAGELLAWQIVNSSDKDGCSYADAVAPAREITGCSTENVDSVLHL